MKLMIASDLHGSAYYTKKLLECMEKEQPEKLLLLGDLLYHGPRNDLPEGYAPKEVISMLNEIKHLRDQGAQLIVAAMHWGNEGQYRPTEIQKNWAHTLIDAGVDIVWGNHSHVLQPIEEYNGGIIYYSLGNCTFGGNTWPRDPDTAVLQQEVILGSDGSIKLGKLTIIPCRVSSVDSGLNNFQPTPYEEGSAGYDRVISKLEGTWKGADLIVDYSNMG